ncbi:protein SENSITIVE TO PROTON RHIZOTOXICITY 2-like [Chenopodium quinoa]|uniref:C2H2-type domain-containing protein n=1 Tax=Chenopodium quinoa TaxID=63459 RepID=A0A803KXP8_CHEQI|nr:protein SENSITIVE TO PROTON RHIZOTOXICITY 2-like [Chenopodium quinoa]
MTDPINTLHLPPPEYTASDDPLTNLTAIRNRVDSLSHILSNSVNGTAPISINQSNSISAELSSAIHAVVINGAALLTTSSSSTHVDGDDLEIVELDVMELTAEHSHTCQVCGKGFKRDANLRMHMRAHGDKYKTMESLSKPDKHKHSDIYGRNTRFSCPYAGCIRNKRHQEFRPLKSVICVKNHFKRSHCPKKFPCLGCKKKQFSVLADLKCHMKNCVAATAVVVAEEESCKCSCGRMFSRKDELFEHMSLFEGHMPVAEDDNKFDVVEEEQDDFGFGLIEGDQCLQDMDYLWSSYEKELLHF